MALNPKHPTGSPMTLGQMYKLGVKRLLVTCLNDTCRHTALVDVSSYPAGTAIPSLGARMHCHKCGGERIDVGPNWREQPP